MPQGLSRKERQYLEQSFTVKLEFDTFPNLVCLNRKARYLFLIGTEGTNGDYSINCDALRYCRSEWQAQVKENDFVCLVVIGNDGADVVEVYSELNGKPPLAGKNGHGDYWWITKSFKHKSAGPPVR